MHGYVCIGLVVWLVVSIALLHTDTDAKKLKVDDGRAFQSAGAAAAANDVTVFSRGEGGYWCIKIPYLFSTQAGTLIALGEGRLLTCSDYAATDLVMKRSEDGGNTWSPLVILHSNSSGTEINVIGNAAPVQDFKSGRILIPFCRNNKEVWQMWSDDDGLTWSPVEQIMTGTLPSWQWVGTGPPGAIQLQSGRIVVPSYHSTIPNDNGEFSEGHVMLSDDVGVSWYLGGSFDYGLQCPNECQAVELANGTVFINSRGLGTNRIAAYSYDGGATFPNIQQISGLPEPFPGCQGSTVRDPETDILYFSGLHESEILRYNLSMHRSYDEGMTWEPYLIVDSGATAYSSLALMKNGSLGLLYEWAIREQIIFDPDYFSFRIVPK